MRDSFASRNGQHNQALSILRQEAGRYGFNCYVVGTEQDRPELQDAMMQQDDDISILWRYRPDLILNKPGVRSILCEIKSDRGHRNFAIEADSCCGVKNWARVHRSVAYAFVDLDVPCVKCVWALDMPPPQRVYFPVKRDEWEADKERLRSKFPDAQFVQDGRRNGSGTPYFLVSKKSGILMPIEQFINSEVLGVVQYRLFDG